METSETASQKTQAVVAMMLVADASEVDDVVRLGAAVEELLQSDQFSAPAVTAFELSLQALQAIYEKTVADAQGVMDAAAAAMSAASEHIARPSEESAAAVEENAQSLRQLLGGCAAQQEPSQAQQSPSLKPAEQQPKGSPENAAAMATPVLPTETDPEILSEFIAECLDHIAAAEAAMLELESSPDDAEHINTIFRAFHTIKGTSGFLGLEHVKGLAHRAESMLDRARNGEIKITGGYADLALRSCDALKNMIEGLRGVEPGQALAVPEDFDELMAELADPESVGIGEESVVEPMRLGDILVGQGSADRQEVEHAAQEQGAQPIGKVLVEKGAASAQDVAKALRMQKKVSGSTAEATVRVGTERLDSLINMVGELVIAQSMVTQDPDVSGGTRPRLSRNVAHAGKIIRELQDLTMSLRMVPLKATFQKMARLVRDLSRKAGKSVQFVTEGDETEIDRNMVEVLNDPLVHMIRNAVDHGIEPPEARTACGKDATGVVRLRAYHSAGSVVIELQDDGKGLDRDRIMAKAVERGLMDSRREVPDSEVFALIFHPGFSTAEKVTDVSGRGVGMDVVKRNIESLRGRIDTSSTLGRGTTFSLRLPLTMAIADAMILRVGDQRYLLPTISIEQSFRAEAAAVSTVIGKAEMVSLRGRLLPLVRLHRLFNVGDAQTDPEKALIVVIEGAGRRCALMVDELLGQQQVVIKSLGRSMGEVSGVAGGSILGDGRVGLILDAAGMIQLATRVASSTVAA